MTNAYEVGCPYCGSRRGVPCMDYRFFAAHPHGARYALAKRQEDEKEEPCPGTPPH